MLEASDPIEAGLLRGMLEDQGIPCVVQNEQTAQVIPTSVFFPELWVQHDEDHERALALIAAWKTESSSAASRRWTCGGCGESIAGTFDSCWKCGRSRGRVG